MSAVAGIYHASGSPVDERLLIRMRDIVAYRGPDGSGIWLNGKIGFAHRLLRTTEESVHEKQPVTDGRGLWLVADCRIDNREELREGFVSREMWKEGPAAPDALCVLAAYRLWGQEAPNHLLGDFAFAIWDERDQSLFCARDPWGLKPLVYHWDGRRFLFGSEMKQIFQDPSVPRALDVPHLADILLTSFPHREGTPYQSVRRLPPGHSLRVRGGSFEVKRYWNWDPDAEPSSRASLGENVERFRFLFEEAVRARLRVPRGYRVGSFLSGGLDSSSIVSVAAALAREEGGSEASPLPVFTLLFPEADPTYGWPGMGPVDESPYAEAVVRRDGLEWHRLEVKGFGPLEDLEENLWIQETPLFFPNVSCFNRLCGKVGTAGVRALLHGEGGDEVFMIGSRLLLGNLRGNPFKFCNHFLQRRKWGASYGDLFSAMLRCFVPEAFKVPYRRFFRKVLPDWIDPHLARRIGLRGRAEQDFRWDPRAQLSSSYGSLCWMKMGNAPLLLEANEHMAAAAGIECRLPFLDLRLHRFLASLPPNLKARDGVSKFILRQAMEGRLPPSVQTRSRKTEFTPAIRTQLERYAGEALRQIFESPHPILRSMIVPEKVQALYEGYFFSRQVRRAPAQGRALWFLWHLMSVDQWLKHRDRFFEKIQEVLHEEEATPSVAGKC